MKLRPLMFAGVLLGLFAIGGALGLGFQWYRGWTITTPFFVTAGNNNEELSKNEAPASDVLAESRPAASTIVPSPAPPAISMSNQLGQPSQFERQLSQSRGLLATPLPPPTTNNTLALNQVRPAPMPPASNELTVPGQQQQSSDRLPALGSQGQTIWVPRAIEGCWEGSGDSSMQYLGGCPNMMSGHMTPIKLRWCFRRIGNEPLKLLMARGAYGGRVAQRWSVTGAEGQSIRFQETISYQTMMFLQVVDVGEWNCRITANDQLSCDEHEQARCGPGGWVQPPWFRGSGWVTARRVSGGDIGSREAAGP
ncbi:MAG TPA: hypothetical protein VKR29_00115 [Candidatus Binataceae bacterium]|nr:hypothetical protein [Candidatus Binataceae bacterium]